MSHLARSAAILAGGQATRFGGRDKSALVVDGRTILDRQIAELASLTDDLIVVGGAESAAPDARLKGSRSNTRVVQDLIPGCGPLGGLHAALTAARGAHVAVLACDMPYVTAPFVAYLFSLAGGAEIVVPRTERGYHPLCAVYARACLDRVAARLAERRLKMTELLDEAAVRIVTADEIERFGDRHRLLANVNTPTEFADLEALHSHKP
jgi:molybdopterin-guanine dinucleotide biosynthesis protein A